MLENSEKLQRVNTKDLFARMLGDVPWSSLRTFLQANAQLLKQATAGGHRLDPKGRPRFEKCILREAEKTEYSQAFTSGLFAVWYPVHEALHKKLEDYFHSDEYKAYREEKGLGEEDYVLPETQFETFFSIDELPEWRILLGFSPLKFTDEQADRILDDSQGNTLLVERIKELEAALGRSEKRDQQLTTEVERLRQDFQTANTEGQEHKKLSRQLRTDLDAQILKADRFQKETRKVREELEAITTSQNTFETRVRDSVRAETTRLQNEVERLQNDLAEWQAKYEEQRLENKRLEGEIVAAKRDRTIHETMATQANQEALHLMSFADLILQRIDWPKVGAAMRLTPRLRQQFNSLIRRLNYEENRSLTIEGTLPVFWDSLMAREKELVNGIAQSNSHEVMAGDVESYWLALTDAFGDVQISLEARGVILKMLQEIFYQVLEMKDLEEPYVPAPKGAVE
ncbi:MAG: hypothetical protein JXR77_14405 [Lentisphaeria bacterium]|nr:hypothetical protein [Lentisphaeria bacterium]